MSSVRISVRWIFGDISNYFKFVDFFLKKNLEIALSSVGKMYICQLHCIMLTPASMAIPLVSFFTRSLLLCKNVFNKINIKVFGWCIKKVISLK